MRKDLHRVCVIGVLVGAACGGSDPQGNGKGDSELSESELKQQAREEASDPSTPVSTDACASHEWYGDGQCEAWCPKGDAIDCARQGPDDTVVCALFFSEADGKCNRTDPCGPVQDADCQAKPGGGHDGCAVACIERLFPTNGKCEPAPGCEYTDPVDCGSDDLICPTIWRVADGKCDATDPCGPYNDEDCQQVAQPDPGPNPGHGGVVCPAIFHAADGKCDETDPCGPANDEDCQPESVPPFNPDADRVVCPTIYIPKDGACPDNPCDPDC